MLVRFTKATTPASPDSIACVRTDGTSSEAAMPRQGILPHLAFHFVVESTMGWRDAVFGRVTDGGSFDYATGELHETHGGRFKNTQILQSEALTECLEASQWGGAPDPAEFAQQLVHACRRRAVPPPDITAEELDRIRVALREFGAAWRPLPPGGSLERTF